MDTSTLSKSALAISLAAIAGCSVGDGPAESDPVGTAEQTVVYSEDTRYGLSVNGLSVNGLSVNGLSVNGLAETDFIEWFSADPTTSAQVMKYVVACAVPSGETRTYTDPRTNETYVWPGSLGLARSWASGNQATRAEQEVVSACLAAHVNKYGVHVAISILGPTGDGSTNLPYTTEELTTFSEPEGCFFGNLFLQGGGVAVGNNGLSFSTGESSARTCAVPHAGLTQCLPMTHVGNCSSLCTLDSTGTFYVECTYGGTTYKPMTTRIRPEEIYTCGDGTCQISERCGAGSTPNNCGLDCGACP